MKIYDISQEVFSSEVYPGDPSPKRETLCIRYDKGSYNLTSFSMGAHNGTHIDAPFHFLNEGNTVDKIPLKKTVGYAFVAEFQGCVTAEDALKMIKKAGRANPEAAKRMILKGDAIITCEAACVFAERGVYLIGTESQSVGPVDAPAEVHKILLGAEVVLLEGARLDGVREGVYLLNAAPLNLASCDGAPCRAILIEL